MSQVKQGNRPFNDPEYDARAQEQRDAVASNPAVQRGILDAQAQFQRNQEGILQDELANLRRVTPDRDRCQATRDSYERTYARVEQTARRVAQLRGRAVPIPKKLPRPSAVEEVVTIEPPAFDLGLYSETHGVGPSGKGMPPVGVPGAADDWVNREAVTGTGSKKR